MTICEGWPEILPAENRHELELLLEHLQTLMPFDRAVLYGRHAGIAPYNDIGGYELLLLTGGKPPLEGWRLEAEAAAVCTIEQRPLHIETARMGLVNYIGNRSWYFTLVRDTGTIIFDNGRLHPFFEWEERRHDIRHTHYRKLYNYHFGAASTLLDEAERLWEEGHAAAAFIDLSFAGRFCSARWRPYATATTSVRPICCRCTNGSATSRMSWRKPFR